MPDSESLTTLREKWKDDADVLARWGHPDEAKILEVCRTDLTENTALPDDELAAELVTVWNEEAAVLEEYGHDGEAATLRICRDRLRALQRRLGEAEEGGDEGRRALRDETPGGRRPARDGDDLEARPPNPFGPESPFRRRDS